jgi:hypothetical protein
MSEVEKKENEGKKTCYVCGQEKTLEEFGKSSRSKDGARGDCKVCRALKYYKRSNPSRRNYSVEVINGKKKCKECGQEKPLAEFHEDAGKKDGRKNTCKICFNLKGRHPDPDKRYYLSEVVNGRKCCKHCGLIKSLDKFVVEKTSRNGRGNTCKTCHNTLYRLRVAEFDKKVALFYGGKCAICGLETDWYEVYECHHLNPKKGDPLISKLVKRNWERVVEPELKKCILLCANCHGHLTHKIAREKPDRCRYAYYTDNRTDLHNKKCIEYIGGGCQICGLITDDHAKYDFHHVDPFIKLYNISQLISRDWDTIIKPELDKCALLCGNCHVSYHFGRYDNLILIPGPRIITTQYSLI